jgi:hypothetical protein
VAARGGRNSFTKGLDSYLQTPNKASRILGAMGLGFMLGATQSVGMVTSLRKNYVRVEVAVHNVDLLPNMVDTVVIGDRLYSFPIQVEGREENEEAGVQMELDNGSNDKGNGADDSSETREPGNNERKGNDQGEGSGQKNPQSSGPKNYGGTSKGLSAGTVAGHGFGYTSASKSDQQETKSVTVADLVGSQENLAGTGAGHGVVAKNLSKEGQQKLKETSAVWRRIHCKGPLF